MSKGRKSQVIKRVILIIIVILIGLLIYLLNPSNVARESLKNINEQGVLGEGVELPKNMHVAFEKYTGTVSIEVAAKDFNYLAKTAVPKYYKICKNMTNEELKNYYTKYSKRIALELGSSSEENFVELVNSICKLTSDNKIEFNSYKVIKDSMIYNNNKTTGSIVITYNEDAKLYLTFVLKADNFSYEHPIEFLSNKEETKTKELENVEENLSENIISNEVINQTGRVIN